MSYSRSDKRKNNNTKISSFKKMTKHREKVSKLYILWLRFEWSLSDNKLRNKLTALPKEKNPLYN